MTTWGWQSTAGVVRVRTPTTSSPAPDLQEHRGEIVSEGRHAPCAHGWQAAAAERSSPRLYSPTALPDGGEHEPSSRSSPSPTSRVQTWQESPETRGTAAHGDVTVRDLAVPAPSQRFMAVRARSHTVEVDASHAVTVSQPGAVARLIDEAARATAG